MNQKIKAVFFVLLLGGILQVYASEMYLLKDSTLKLKSGQTVKLFLGIPVGLKKKIGKEAEVTVRGFQFADKLYMSKKKKLLIAVLPKGKKPNANNTNMVELTGSISQAHLTEDFSEVWEEQEEFFFDMCTQCHAAPNVKHHSMTEWEALLGTMKGFAKIDEKETAFLLRYLQSHASDGWLKAITKH